MSLFRIFGSNLWGKWVEHRRRKQKSVSCRMEKQEELFHAPHELKIRKVGRKPATLLWTEGKASDPGMTKDVVCLANSRKYSGFCFAGKEISPNGFGSWVRPVSAREKGELSDLEISLDNNEIPKLLDIVTIKFKGHRPHLYQSENYLISCAQWKWKKKLNPSLVPELCDDVPQLWINGYSSFRGFNDRIPYELATKKISSSLVLVKAEELIVQVVEGKTNCSKKCRADFSYRRNKYNLAITDPRIEEWCSTKQFGCYPCRKTPYLTISIGEPFEGYCYKLVASIIFF
jgi:hypothetical protein